jgi:SulP family sulfate permease
MVPGTLAGELTGLSGLERNATVVVERDAVVWKLSREKLKALEKEQPELARVFTRLVMRGNDAIEIHTWCDFLLITFLSGEG